MVVAALVLIALLFLTPRMDNGAGKRGAMIQSLNHAREIHLATQQMALDRHTTGDQNIGWPGDINGGLPESADASDFAKILVETGYISRDNLKVFTAPGIPPAPDLANLTRENVAFAIGRVTEVSPGSTLFIVSCNYIGPPEGLDPGQAPFGSRGWVAMRKGGDGSNYRSTQAHFDPKDARMHELVGLLPPGWLGGANPTLPPVADSLAAEAP